MKHICIYCKQEKDESEFNREHVIPQMFGRYKQALVLNNHQVCQECNSYFSIKLEGAIALDSIEAFERMQHGTKKMTDGRTLKGNRSSVEFAETILKGIPIKVVSDSTNPEGIHLSYGPLIGIHKDGEGYDFFHPSELPPITKEIADRLKCYKEPIITIGLSDEESKEILKGQGYLNDSFKSSWKKTEDMLGTDNIMIKINDIDDSIKRRLAAKTVMNYLCYKYGVEYVLQSKFDDIRNYIRHGVFDSDNLFFQFKTEPLKIFNLPNPHSHALGLVWDIDQDTAYYTGVLTWFGKLTYIIRLFEDKDLFVRKNIQGVNTLEFNRQIDDTWILYSDNDNKIQTEENSIFLIQRIKE